MHWYFSSVWTWIHLTNSCSWPMMSVKSGAGNTCFILLLKSSILTFYVMYVFNDLMNYTADLYWAALRTLQKKMESSRSRRSAVGRLTRSKDTDQTETSNWTPSATPRWRSNGSRGNVDVDSLWAAAGERFRRRSLSAQRSTELCLSASRRWGCSHFMVP